MTAPINFSSQSTKRQGLNGQLGENFALKEPKLMLGRSCSTLSQAIQVEEQRAVVASSCLSNMVSVDNEDWNGDFLKRRDCVACSVLTEIPQLILVY